MYDQVHACAHQGLSPVIQVRPTQLFVKEFAVIWLVRNAVDPILLTTNFHPVAVSIIHGFQIVTLRKRLFKRAGWTTSEHRPDLSSDIQW